MIELFANNFSTTLAASVAAGDTTVNTISAAPASLQGGQFRIRIDSEYMIVTAGQSGTVWTVTRGAESSTAAAHTSGTAVYHTLTAGALTTIAQTAAAVGGDLSGTLPDPTVKALQGRPVSSNAPASSNGLVWNGSAWAPAAIVNSFNARSGAVTPQAGDYNAAQVTNAADKSSTNPQLFTSSLGAGMTGITGRYVGATNGQPTGGPYNAGDFANDMYGGVFWLCISGGSPGTWVKTAGVFGPDRFTISYQNGWVGNNYAGVSYSQYWMDGIGNIWAWGSCSGGASASTAFTLPVGYRPPQTVFCATYTAAYGSFNITVNSAGACVFNYTSPVVSSDNFPFFITYPSQ